MGERSSPLRLLFGKQKEGNYAVCLRVDGRIILKRGFID
jgi:hypothetical protein